MAMYRVVAEENAYRLKSQVSQHGYNISFPVFNNALNEGLPSLAKTKFWRREELNVKTRAQNNILLE